MVFPYFVVRRIGHCVHHLDVAILLRSVPYSRMRVSMYWSQHRIQHVKRKLAQSIFVCTLTSIWITGRGESATSSPNCNSIRYCIFVWLVFELAFGSLVWYTLDVASLGGKFSRCLYFTSFYTHTAYACSILLDPQDYPTISSIASYDYRKIEDAIRQMGRVASKEMTAYDLQ